MSDYLKIMPATTARDCVTTITIGTVGDSLPLPAGTELVIDASPGSPTPDTVTITVLPASASEIPPPITPRGYEYTGRSDDGGWVYSAHGVEP